MTALEAVRHSDMDRNEMCGNRDYSKVEENCRRNSTLRGDPTVDMMKMMKEGKPRGATSVHWKEEEKLGDHSHTVNFGGQERVQREHERLGAGKKIQFLH